MGKRFCPHRVVVRNSDDKIISDQECESFAVADPIWIARCGQLADGCSVALQHGSRVIKWHVAGDIEA